LTLASEFRELRSKWQTLSIYEKLEQLVVAVLTTVIALIIALATWQLLVHTLTLVEGSHLVSPADSQIFQGLFGTVLAVLIAMEFKHTLLVVRRHRRAIVRGGDCTVIADLSFLISTRPPELNCGIGRRGLRPRNRIWLVTNREGPQEVEAQERFFEPDHLE
jgi:hypothetical protein